MKVCDLHIPADTQARLDALAKRGRRRVPPHGRRPGDNAPTEVLGADGQPLDIPGDGRE